MEIATETERPTAQSAQSAPLLDSFRMVLFKERCPPAPHLLEWRDEAGDADDASVGKELGHFTDAANILLPVLGGKPQVLVQPCPDVVTVQYISGNSPTTEVLLKGKRNGCLASSRETFRESDSKVNRGVCALVCVCVHTKLRHSTPQSSAGSDHKKGQVARGH